MIVKLAYEGWKYFEGEEVQVVCGQSFLSNIQDGVIILIPNLPPQVKKDFGITIIYVTNGANKKIIFIPYGDVDNRVTGYLLNNEGKTIDKI